MGFYIDFIKDIIIAANVTFLFEASWNFKNLVIIFLWVTVFLSQTLIGLKILSRGPARIFGYSRSHLGSLCQRMSTYLFLVVTCPLAPALLLFLNARLVRQIRPSEKKMTALIRHKMVIRRSLMN